MPRPALPRAERLSEITFVKLRRGEKCSLTEISRKRRRARLRNWSVSAILREAFVAALEGRRPDWVGKTPR